MITKMTKYSFILLSGETGNFLKKLQDFGIVDIARSKKPVDKESSAMLDKALEIKKVIAFLNRTDFGKDADADAIKSAAESAAVSPDKVSATLEAAEEIERLKASLAVLGKERAERLPWGDFSKDEIDRLAKNGIGLGWYKVPKRKFDSEWSRNCALQVVEDDGNYVWFVVASASGEKPDIPADPIPAPGGTWRESQAGIEKAEKEIINAKGRLLRMKEYVPELQKAYNEEMSRFDLYLANASGEMAADEMLTVFTGFAPAEDEDRLTAEFERMDIAYLKENAVEEDNPPIKLRNNWFARQFEVLTGMYGMPVYSEFDPTPILGPFFLLFFALCMGDAGYGILLIIIGQLLRSMTGSMARLGPLVTILGAGCIFVGIILGTFFGINLAEASWVPEWLKKCMITGEIAGYSAQMILAIGIGVFHICLAMTVKAICYTKRFGFKANISTWAWLILIIGGIITAAVALPGVISGPAFKWTVITLGTVSGLGIYIFNTPGRNPLINIGSGLWETYNMATGLLGDVLSYIRLYALGLAGGMLGGAFNNLAIMLRDGIPVPGLDWIGFAAIVLLGHALNLAMSCLGAFVHPLRLTFVEYFKNSGYEGRGRIYNPLGRQEAE